MVGGRDPRVPTGPRPHVEFGHCIGAELLPVDRCEWGRSCVGVLGRDRSAIGRMAVV